jgi:transposase
MSPTTAPHRSGQRRRSPRQPRAVGKPSGLLHPRVQQVGPQRFGILCVDCAKSRSMWMLADFYGEILWGPQTVHHSRGDLEAALAALREVRAQRQIGDAVAAIERTGSYHLLVKRALVAADWQVRIVHPLASSQFRRSADAGNKTDQTDLMAIHRAVVTGLGLLEPQVDEPYRQLQLLIRHRRDLVKTASKLRCRMHEHLHAAMPGFAALFDDLWASPLPMTVVRHVGPAQVVADLGESGMARLLDQHKVGYQRRSLAKILAWARTAPAPDADGPLHRALCLHLDDDHSAQQRRITDIERQIARRLVAMPYILLLSIPGINVVSAADLAGEMGPITLYASPTHITGRAGLFPSRYQSDQTDRADGPLVCRGNRRLRAALMTIADNLIEHNQHFRGKVHLHEAQGKDPRKARVKVAKTFSRIAFHMLAGGRVFNHRCCRQRHYILEKLIEFAREHQTPADELLGGLRAAINQLPGTEHHAEAQPLQTYLQRTRAARRGSEPQRLGDILPLVLAELGLPAVVESDSRSQDPS